MNITLMGAPEPGGEDLSKPSCYQSRVCKDVDPGCPTPAMIFKGKPSILDPRKVHQYVDLPDIPVGYMNEHVLNFADHSLGSGPSTGYCAFLTLLPACSNMTLYGFSGGDSAD